MVVGDPVTMVSFGLEQLASERLQACESTFNAVDKLQSGLEPVVSPVCPRSDIGSIHELVVCPMCG